MKKVFFKQIAVMLLAIILISSCQKENVAPIPSDTDLTAKQKNAVSPDIRSITLDNSTEIKSATACLTCETSTKTYDLLDQLKTMPLKEGNNLVVTLPSGTQLIALVQKGFITQWAMLSKSRLQVLPSSTIYTYQTMMRMGFPFKIYRICFYLDGIYTCWRVIKL